MEMIKQSHPEGPAASPEGVSWSPLSQSRFTARLLLLIAALAIPFCLLLCISSVQSAMAEVKLDNVQRSIPHSAK